MNYDDIINLTYIKSKRRKQMTLDERAAQFMPFAALTGYGEMVKETGRLTSKRINLDDDMKEKINNKLLFLNSKIKEKPMATFTYFINDIRKQGGKYITVSGNIKKIDLINHMIVLVDNTKIPINDIIDIN